jgi:hypothetical protein
MVAGDATNDGQLGTNGRCHRSAAFVRATSREHSGTSTA